MNHDQAKAELRAAVDAVMPGVPATIIVTSGAHAAGFEWHECKVEIVQARHGGRYVGYFAAGEAPDLPSLAVAVSKHTAKYVAQGAVSVTTNAIDKDALCPCGSGMKAHRCKRHRS